MQGRGNNIGRNIEEKEEIKGQNQVCLWKSSGPDNGGIELQDLEHHRTKGELDPF